MPVKKTIRAELFVAENEEWSFRIIAGNGRITMGPGETYKLRGGARRALRTLMEASCSSPGLNSPLAHACAEELDREQAAWDKRKKPAGKGH